MPSKTFCVLPWYSREINNNRETTCCLLPKHHDIEKIKRDLLSQIRSPDCQKCWDLEDRNQDSRRMQENRFLDWKLNRDIEKIEEDCVQGHDQTLLYQVYLSNLCNQACMTCNSYFSTKWAEVERRMELQPRPPQYNALDDLGIDFKTARRINILGGEPMFDPNFFHLLERLLKHDNDGCFISFVTNGSISLSVEQKNILKNFKNLNICFSIDGIESKFEYIRWPGKWATLLEHLDQYKSVTDNFSVSYTISAINAIYYDETIDWFKKQNLRYNHNIVTDPEHFSLRYMPVEIKHYLRNHYFFNEFAKITGDELSADDFLGNIKKQDAAKKTSITDYMPELLKLLNGSLKI